MPEAEVDTSALDRLRALGGPALLGKMIELYLENTPKRLDALRRGRGLMDWTEVERAAHSLKSSSANLGFHRLRDLAQEIETMAERKVEAPLGSLVERLEAAFPEVRARLEDERARLVAPP